MRVFQLKLGVADYSIATEPRPLIRSCDVMIGLCKQRGGAGLGCGSRGRAPDALVEYMSASHEDNYFLFDCSSWIVGH